MPHGNSAIVDTTFLKQEKATEVSMWIRVTRPNFWIRLIIKGNLNSDLKGCDVHDLLNMTEWSKR